jgi:anti-sigma B factor antagonist
MDLNVERPWVGVVRVVGRLDGGSAARFRAAVAHAIADGSHHLVVDLREVPFIDSAGVGALVSSFKAARRADGDLRIAGPNDRVKMSLDLTSLQRLLPLYATVAEALAGYAVSGSTRLRAQERQSSGCCIDAGAIFAGRTRARAARSASPFVTAGARRGIRALACAIGVPKTGFSPLAFPQPPQHDAYQVGLQRRGLGPGSLIPHFCGARAGSVRGWGLIIRLMSDPPPCPVPSHRGPGASSLLVRAL